MKKGLEGKECVDEKQRSHSLLQLCVGSAVGFKDFFGGGRDVGRERLFVYSADFASIIDSDGYDADGS